MDLEKPIARTLDDSPRLLGMSPFELGACVSAYAIFNTLLRGVPFSALLSLGSAVIAALTLRVLNLTKPPAHALYWAMRLFRHAILPVMPWQREDGENKS